MQPHDPFLFGMAPTLPKLSPDQSFLYRIPHTFYQSPSSSSQVLIAPAQAFLPPSSELIFAEKYEDTNALDAFKRSYQDYLRMCDCTIKNKIRQNFGEKAISEYKVLLPFLMSSNTKANSLAHTEMVIVVVRPFGTDEGKFDTYLQGSAVYLVIKPGQVINWYYVARKYASVSTKSRSRRTYGIMFLIQIYTLGNTAVQAAAEEAKTVRSNYQFADYIRVEEDITSTPEFVRAALVTSVKHMVTQTAFPAKLYQIPTKVHSYLKSHTIEGLFTEPPEKPTPTSTPWTNLISKTHDEVANQQKQATKRPASSSASGGPKAKKRNVGHGETSALLGNSTKKCPVVEKDGRELILHRYVNPTKFSGSLCFAFTETTCQVVYAKIGWMLTNTEIPTFVCNDCWVYLKGKAGSVVSLVLYSDGSLSIQLERRTTETCQLYIGEKGWHRGIVFDLYGRAFAYIEPTIDLEAIPSLGVTAGGGYESTESWQNQLEGTSQVATPSEPATSTTTTAAECQQRARGPDLMMAALYDEDVNAVKQILKQNPFVLDERHPNDISYLEIIKGVVRDSVKHHFQRNLPTGEDVDDEEGEDEDETPFILSVDYLNKIYAVALLGNLLASMKKQGIPTLADKYSFLLEQSEDNTQEIMNTVFKQDENGETLLHLAIRNNWSHILSALLDFNFLMDSGEPSKESYLWFAVKHLPPTGAHCLWLLIRQADRQRVISRLLAQLDKKSNKSMIEGLLKSSKHELALVLSRYLPEVFNLELPTAAHDAVIRNDVATLSLIIRHVKLHNIPLLATTDEKNGWSLLHYAAASGNYQAVDLLVKAGVRINTLTPKNDTVLHLAARSNPYPPEHCSYGGSYTQPLKEVNYSYNNIYGGGSGSSFTKSTGPKMGGVTSELVEQQKFVDLCFMFDATGGMSAHIALAVQSIKDIVAKAQEKMKTRILRLAFVGYRDYPASPTAPVVEFLNFTQNVDLFMTSLSKIQATGGGDECEDVVSGLLKVQELEWSSNTRILFWIADAPCHGEQYHDGMNDAYAKAPPKERPAYSEKELLEKLKVLNIRNFFFLKINSTTDKMVGMFKGMFDSQGFELKQELINDNKAGFVEQVVGSVMYSINFLRQQL